jgi:hypothetical protein
MAPLYRKVFFSSRSARYRLMPRQDYGIDTSILCCWNKFFNLYKYDINIIIIYI